VHSLRDQMTRAELIFAALAALSTSEAAGQDMAS
jgi:hypothetical protein